MSDLSKYLIERMVEGAVEGTCAVILHMLKYVPGIQGVDDEAVYIGGCPLAYVPDHFKTQGMCIKTVAVDLWQFWNVPDHFKTKKMCERAVEDEPYTLKFVPDHLKTKKMCERAVKKDPYNLKFVPDHIKTQEMCERVVEDDPDTQELVPDWFVNNKIVEWYEGYKKHKAQKAKIKEELLPIAWYSGRPMDWCVSEGENERWK